MLQQPFRCACPLAKIVAGHSGFTHTGNIALQQTAIQGAGGAFCVCTIKKQPFSDTDTDELFGMLCVKRLICQNIRRKLTPLICDSRKDGGNRLSSVFRFVIALAGGWNGAEMRDSFICGINMIERAVNFYALPHKVLDCLRYLRHWLLWRFLRSCFGGAHLCLRPFIRVITEDGTIPILSQIVNGSAVIRKAAAFHRAVRIALRSFFRFFQRLIVPFLVKSVYNVMIRNDLILRCHPVGIIINHFFGQPFRFLRECVIQLPHFDDLLVDAACP